MADSAEYREAPSDLLPLAYLQDKYPFLKKDLVWVFEKWYKWTEKEGNCQYPKTGSFDKERCRVVREIVKGRQANKDKKKATELYITVLRLLTTEGQILYAQSQLKTPVALEGRKTGNTGSGPVCPTAHPPYEDGGAGKAVNPQSLEDCLSPLISMIVRGEMREEDDERMKSDRQNISRDGKKEAEEWKTLSSYRTPTSPYLLGSPTFPLDGRTDLPKWTGRKNRPPRVDGQEERTSQGGRAGRTDLPGWTGSDDLDRKKKGKGGEKENMYLKVRTSRDKFYEQKLEKEEKAEIEDQLGEIGRKRKEKRRDLAALGDKEDEETERKMGQLKEEIDSLDTATDGLEEGLRKMRLNPTPKKSSSSSDYRMYKTDPQGQVYVEYKPWRFGDIETAVKGMVRITKGADTWIRDFENKHGHQDMCLGDIKALLSHVLTPGQFSDAMRICQLDTQPPELRLGQFRAELWAHLRTTFPMIRDLSRLTDHVYGVDTDFDIWIDGLKRKWVEELGVRHDNTFETEEIFYDTACRNSPDKVQAKARDVVGWHRMDGPTKEDHLRHFCRMWSNEKTEEKTRKAGLDDALKKARLEQLEKANKSTGGPDLVRMNTPVPVALFSGPGAAPQPFVRFPPQAYGNPQPFPPPTPPMGPVQSWGCGQFGHIRNRCPQGPQYTRAWNPQPGFRRRRGGNYRGGNRGRYQGQGRSWKKNKDHGGRLTYVNQAGDLKIDIENHYTRIPCTPEIIEYSPQQRQDEDDLSSVPDYLWSKGGHDVGLIKSAEPVLVRLKPGYEGPRQKQYPMSPEGEEGLGTTIGELNQGQVIYPSNSPYNTPILPVKTPTGKYRMEQDFRHLNQVVDSEFPLVPDPSVILSRVPPEASTFSVIDLHGAFFSVPLHPDCHNLFSFSYKGTQYTYNRLPLGFCESPSIFNRVLQNDLRDVVFPGGSTLVQHVDDLFICSPTPEICKIDTLHLLKELAVRGHKVSKEKLQLWKPKVLFIGLEISQHQKTLSKERIKTILTTPRPVNIKGLMSFLGCTGYCRNWICDYSVIARPLREMCSGRPSEKLVWNKDQAKAFEDLKRALASAPALDLPDFKKHFYIYVAERGGFASAVVTQKVSNKHKPCAYYSTRLDNVVRGMNPCVRSLAATADAIEKSASLILMHNATVYVSHGVLALMNQKNSCPTAARLAGYKTLLTQPNLTIERCATVNPADLLAARQEGAPHCCE
uniref:ribonuclease H n=1 Tax=Hucho hucho TaxID=62062 RepID=A0A4W5MLS8_9TELE